MTLRRLSTIALAAAVLPAAAHGAGTVFGTTAARSCYEAAAFAGGGPGAIASCDEALQREQLTGSEHVATLVNRGILRSRSGDAAGALADFDAAIARDPEEADAYLNKGVVLARSPQNWREALSLFGLAIEKGSSRPELAYYARGVAHERLGDAAAAYRDYRQAGVLAPDWPAPAAELARFTVKPK